MPKVAFFVQLKKVVFDSVNRFLAIRSTYLLFFAICSPNFGSDSFGVYFEFDFFLPPAALNMSKKNDETK